MDLYAGLISPAGIGMNVLGRTWYDQYVSGRNIDDMILLVASNGFYQFQDTAVDEAEKFSRIRLMQDGKEIPIGADLMKTLPFHHATGGPDLQEIGLLFFTTDSGFDPIKPWQIELDVQGDGDDPAVATFALEYELPGQFIRTNAPAPVADAGAEDATEVAAADTGDGNDDAAPAMLAGTGGGAEESATSGPAMLSGTGGAAEESTTSGPAMLAGTGGAAEEPATSAPAMLADTGSAAEGVAPAMLSGVGGAAEDPAIPAPADTATVAEDVAATSSINWRQIWANNTDKIYILIATLAVLVLILSFQDAIARHRQLHKWIRIAFLAWVLVWLGWVAGAQLTIISLLNIAQSVVFDFDLAFFMVEPLIFILMAFVAVGLFLWGRAIFCGWLCPFGALQELLNKIAVALRIPQIKIPEAIHERLISVKYLVFLGLLGLTFYSFDLAIAGTNVEPFKTAITFRFDAPAAAVAYALVLLGIGLFVERFYCRVICPLGAGLSILGRVRMFDWLKRRPECGNPCHRCEAVCPTGAIKSSGAIDMNECFYCLDCQVTYYDDHECPPLAQRRKRLDALTPSAPQAQPAE